MGVGDVCSDVVHDDHMKVRWLFTQGSAGILLLLS